MRLNIVIPVHNQVDYLKRCMESIGKTRPRSIDVTVDVIDNGSTDDVLSVLYELMKGNSRVCWRYFRNETNTGVTVPWNQGIRRAIVYGYDVVCICNSDVVFGVRALEECFNYALALDAVFPLTIQSGPLPAGFEELARMAAEFEACSTAVTDNLLAGSQPRNLEILRSLFTQKNRAAIADTGGFAGWCFFLSRHAIETVGLFDEQFTLWYQDTDYHHRLRAAGIPPIECRSCLIHHFESKTILSMPQQFEFHGWRKQDEQRYFTKYPRVKR